MEFIEATTLLNPNATVQFINTIAGGRSCVERFFLLPIFTLHRYSLKKINNTLIHGEVLFLLRD